MANEDIVVVDTENNEGEGNENESDFVKVSKSDYEKLNQTLGSLKRENKDFKKKFEESEKPKETPEKNQPDDNRLLEKLERMSLRQAGITHQDDVDLMKSLAKKWNMDIDEIVGDEDALAKLEKQRTQRSNVEATSGIKGSGNSSQAKNTPEYWLAKGEPPTSDQVPDKKARVKIIRAFMAKGNSKGKTFYND